MSEKVVERVNRVTKQLFKLNLISMVLALVLWISSVWYAMTMGLKYGLTYEVTTLIGEVERTSTQNTIFNVIMSGAFSWMLLTSIFSALYLFGLSHAAEGVERIK